MIADEVLFERFRRRGDATALAQLFDRTAPALLRIALHLAGDPAGAVDLLQSTFLAAIEAREQWDAERPLMPWLCGVLKNRARALRREAARTLDPVRLRPPASVDPVRAAEVAEFDAAVDAAIAQMPVPYQPVLRLHLAYDHTPAEIAHALSRAPATVRSQLARGLAMLRAALPASLLAAVGSAASPGRGLSAVRAAVLAQATSTAGVAGVVLASSLVGGALLMKKVLAVLVVAALAALLWTQWPEAEPPTALPTAKQDAAKPAQGDPGTARAEVTANERVPVAPTPTDPQATTGTLHVKVLWPDGTPSTGLHLNIEPDRGQDTWLERDVVTAADGTVTVTDLKPGDGQLRVDWRRGAGFTIVAGQTTECEVKLPPGMDVHGIVVDEDGQPVPTARVWLSRFFVGDQGQELGPVNRDGTFVIRALPPNQQQFLAAVAPGKRVSTLTRIQGAAGTTQDVRIELRFAGVSLLGRVFLPGNQGIQAKGARVLVGMRNMSNAWDQERFTRDFRPPVDTRCDDQGCFRADGLSPGSSVAVWIRSEHSATLLQNVQLMTDRDSVVQFDLFDGGSFHGAATDPDGAPVSGAFVGARSEALWDLKRQDRFFFGPSWAGSGTVTAADGSYRIDHVTASAVRLSARQHKPQRGAETTLPVKDKGLLTWNPVLTTGASIQGFVVDGHREPLVGWIVHGGDATQSRRATTDARGHFELTDCGDKLWRVSVDAPNGADQYTAAAKLGVRGGTTDLHLIVPQRAIPDATMTGRLLGADGNPAKQGYISYWRQGAMSLEGAGAGTEKDGRFKIGLLPAGNYRVRAQVDAARTAWSEQFALRQGETLDLGTLRPDPTGSVRATVRDAEGKLLDGVECQIVEQIEGLDQAFPGARTQAGVATIALLQPGAYRLRITGRDQPVRNTPFTVVEGQEAKVEVTVPNSVQCMLRMSPPSEGAPLQVSFTWSRDGEVFLQHVDWWRANEELVLPRRLVPGVYVITIQSETGKREENRFTVATGDADGKEIAVKLP